MAYRSGFKLLGDILGSFLSDCTTETISDLTSLMVSAEVESEVTKFHPMSGIGRKSYLEKIVGFF